MKRGEIYRYHYLWSHQHQRGEVSGRKGRPVCLILRSAKNPNSLYLFPLTSQPPSSERMAVSVPEVECRRIGLAAPCWIVVDEYNVLTERHLYDFESLTPIGALSDRFLGKVAELVALASRRKRLMGVRRD